MKTRTLFADVPAELHKRIKIFAAEQDRDIKDVVREAVEKFLDGHPAVS